MGVKYKATIYFDSANMGAINRLLEDGVVTSLHCKRAEEEEHDARKFAEALRSGKSHASNGATPHPRTHGINVTSCVLAVMQRRPEDIWSKDDIGVTIEADFQFNRNSSSPALSVLKKLGFVERISLGTYILTEKGRTHSQNEPIPSYEGSAT